MRLVLWALAALLTISGAAVAQNTPVHQVGRVTPGHALSWTSNGVVQDAGGAANGNLKELGITNTGTPTCINDASTSSPTGYHQLCFGANATVGSVGPPAGGAGGAVVGPASSTVGDCAAYGNTVGTLLFDLPCQAPTPATAFGAKCDGSTDDTAAINAALASSDTMPVALPTGKACNIAGTIAMSKPGAMLTSGAGAGAATINCVGTGAASCIVMGSGVLTSQIAGQKLSNLIINSPTRTGGECVDVIGANVNTTIYNVYFSSCYNGIFVEFINDLRMTGLNGAFRGKFGTKLFAPAASGNAARSDNILMLQDAWNGLYGGGDCFVWDGPVYTVRFHSVAALQCARALYVENSASSNSFYPQFGFFNDFEADGSTLGTVIAAGSDFYFSNSDLDINNSSVTGSVPALTVLPDSSASFTRGIVMATTKIHDTPQSAAYINGRDIQIAASEFFDTNHQATGTTPQVEIGPNADRVTIADSSVGQRFGDPDAPNYGVQVDAGAGHVVLANLTAQGATTASFNDLSGGAQILGGVEFNGSGVGPALAYGGTNAINQKVFDFDNSYVSGLSPSGSCTAGSPSSVVSTSIGVNLDVGCTFASLGVNNSGGGTAAVSSGISLPGGILLNAAAGPINLNAAGTGGGLKIDGVSGVTCSGSPTSSFASSNGIVTHC